MLMEFDTKPLDPDPCPLMACPRPGASAAVWVYRPRDPSAAANEVGTVPALICNRPMD